MVKERVYGLKQSVLILLLRWQILLNIGGVWQLTDQHAKSYGGTAVGWLTHSLADSVSPSYLYDVGPYLISSENVFR